MKLRTIILGVFFTLSLASCKKDEKATDANATPTEQAAVNDNIMTLTLNAVVKKDDSFQIYYKQDNDFEAPFDEKSSMYVDVKGSEAAQDIVFKLPKDVMPTMFRFDFGLNKGQSTITVNSFKMSFNGKTFDIKGADFFKFFYANETTLKIDAAASTATPLTTKEGVYDPMFISQPVLNDELAKLFG